MMATIQGSDIRKLVVACEAGMGSSVLLVSTLKKRLKGTNVDVGHTPVRGIPADADVVVCHRGLEATARSVAPDKVIVPFDVFMGDPAFDRLVEAITGGGPIEG